MWTCKGNGGTFGQQRKALSSHLNHSRLWPGCWWSEFPSVTLNGVSNVKPKTSPLSPRLALVTVNIEWFLNRRGKYSTNCHPSNVVKRLVLMVQLLSFSKVKMNLNSFYNSWLKTDDKDSVNNPQSDEIEWTGLQKIWCPSVRSVCRNGILEISYAVCWKQRKNGSG